MRYWTYRALQVEPWDAWTAQPVHPPSELRRQQYNSRLRSSRRALDEDGDDDVRDQRRTTKRQRRSTGNQEGSVPAAAAGTSAKGGKTKVADTRCAGGKQHAHASTVADTMLAGDQAMHAQPVWQVLLDDLSQKDRSRGLQEAAARFEYGHITATIAHGATGHIFKAW